MGSHKRVSALESKSLNLKDATRRSFTFYVTESTGESLKVIKFKWHPLGTRTWAFRSRSIHSISVMLSLKRKQERQTGQKMDRKGTADVRKMTFKGHPLR